MKTQKITIQRLWPYLSGEPEEYVTRSATGKRNQWLRAAWSSHVADRAMLLVTLAWLGLRYLEWKRIEVRPDGLYEPKMWLAELVFPSLPSPYVFYTLLAVTVLLTLLCLRRPRFWQARALLVIALLLVSVPSHGFGHIEHTGHLLLLAHIYTVFRPTGQPRTAEEAKWQSRGYSWFLLGALAVYTVSGVWKVVDMTIRDLLKPGVTWLNPVGMFSTAIASMRGVDLGMAVPQVIEGIAWIFPIGYILLTVIFVGSFIAAFRRSLLLIVVPTIVFFHLMNAIAMYVLFLVTIFIAIAILSPYDLFVSRIRTRLVPVSKTTFSGRRSAAVFRCHYEDGSTDDFHSFYAYRERIRHRSAVLASPLYYPGLGFAVSHAMRILDRRQISAG